MSMILDAIKRSKDGPEGGGYVPSLDTEHYVAADEPIWRKLDPKFVVLMASAVVVATLALMHSSERGGSDTSDIEGGTSIERAAEKKPADSVAATPKTMVSNAKPQTALTSSTSVSGLSARNKDGQQSSDGMSDTRPIVIPTETQPANRSGPNAERLSSLYAAMNQEAEATLGSSTNSETGAGVVPDQRDQAAEVSGVAEARDETTAVDFAEILAQAQKELGVQPLVESDEPLLETLSQQTKDQIPSLIYSEHNYSANGRSEVVLNGQSLTDRQRVGPFTVVEILPDSVILRWRETQFRVRARNSWINM